MTRTTARTIRSPRKARQASLKYARFPHFFCLHWSARRGDLPVSVSQTAAALGQLFSLQPIPYFSGSFRFRRDIAFFAAVQRIAFSCVREIQPHGKGEPDRLKLP